MRFNMIENIKCMDEMCEACEKYMKAPLADDKASFVARCRSCVITFFNRISYTFKYSSLKNFKIIRVTNTKLLNKFESIFNKTEPTNYNNRIKNIIERFNKCSFNVSIKNRVAQMEAKFKSITTSDPKDPIPGQQAQNELKKVIDTQPNPAEPKDEKLEQPSPQRPTSPSSISLSDHSTAQPPQMPVSQGNPSPEENDKRPQTELQPDTSEEKKDPASESTSPQSPAPSPASSSSWEDVAIQTPTNTKQQLDDPKVPVTTANSDKTKDIIPILPAIQPGPVSVPDQQTNPVQENGAPLSAIYNTAASVVDVASNTRLGSAVKGTFYLARDTFDFAKTWWSSPAPAESKKNN